MATATCQTIAGPYSAAQPFKIRSSTCQTVAGAEMAAADVAWGGSQSRRARVSWIPGAHVPVLDANGRMSQSWYRFFVEVAESRLGGIDAPSVPQVVTTTQQTQEQVLSVYSGVQSVGAQVSAITDTVNTQTQVAQNNNLSGASQIQRLPSYKLDQLGRLDD